MPVDLPSCERASILTADVISKDLANSRPVDDQAPRDVANTALDDDHLLKETRDADGEEDRALAVIGDDHRAPRIPHTMRLRQPAA